MEKLAHRHKEVTHKDIACRKPQVKMAHLVEQKLQN